LSDIIYNAMQMLKPVTNYVETYAAMWERILDVKPMEMREAVNKRVKDGTPFALRVTRRPGLPCSGPQRSLLALFS
jgi:hypothetical protein